MRGAKDALKSSYTGDLTAYATFERSVVKTVKTKKEEAGFTDEEVIDFFRTFAEAVVKCHPVEGSKRYFNVKSLVDSG